MTTKNDRALFFARRFCPNRFEAHGYTRRSMASVDLAAIRYALAVARERGYGEVELETEGTLFRAVLTPGKRSVQTTPTDVPSSEPIPVESPVVGVLAKLRADLRPGARVKEGDVLGSIVSLGLPTDLECPCAGEVVEVLLKDGAAVEYGQAVLTVRRIDAKP